METGARCQARRRGPRGKPRGKHVATAQGTVTAGPDDELAALDARFAELRAEAAVTAAVRAALDPETEDTAMPALLAAGFEAWVRELGAGDEHPFAQDPPPGKNPRLHASLRLVLDPRTERHRRWAFRAIAAGHPRAVQSRLRKAAEASGLDAGRTDRHLFVLRNAPWPSGKVTEQETAALAAKGGVVLPASPEDLAVFAALAVLTVEHDPALNAWLAARRPAHATRLLAAALAGGRRACRGRRQGQPRGHGTAGLALPSSGPLPSDPPASAPAARGRLDPAPAVHRATRAGHRPGDPHRPARRGPPRRHPGPRVPPPPPGDLRRLGFGQDGPAPPRDRGVRAARRLLDRA